MFLNKSRHQYTDFAKKCPLNSEYVFNNEVHLTTGDGLQYLHYEGIHKARPL